MTAEKLPKLCFHSALVYRNFMKLWRCCVRGAAVFCGAMATGGCSFTTILRTLGGPARGVVRPGRYASGAGYTVLCFGPIGKHCLLLGVRIGRLDAM